MFPKLSNINPKILQKIKSYSTADKASELVPWIRVFSGAKRGNLNGLILQSNTSFDLLRATGESTTSIYGDSQSSGIMGLTWDGKIVESLSERTLRPSPIITQVDIKEGQDQISREATISITAYTLGQMELIQTYFLEPGYSLFIEFGFNNSGARGLTNTNGKNTDQIVEEITNKSLNYVDLNKTRLAASGEYDAFLGFIVGGNVESSGDVFNITINLRGEPSLPTYLQTYKNTKLLDENRDKIFSTSKVAKLFDLESFEDDESSLAKRRFAYLFNELPANKQIQSVKSLIDEVSLNQFINFDKSVEKSINSSIDSWVTKNVEKDGVDVKRELLFSKKKFIRMDLAIKILNKIGQVNRFIIGKKSIAFTINIDNVKIGGFENIYSTNSNKLIIPGTIPDFYAYFLQTDTVTQSTTGLLKTADNEYPPREIDDNLVPFLENTPIDTDVSEEKNYYGYLKHLFINFDVFKSKLEKPILNTREVFIDLLNELSSAVNAFWKFQVVESEFQQRNILSVDDLLERGQFEEASLLLDENGIERKVGDIEVTVVDENWIGKIPSNKKDNIATFQHNGIGSVFKSANLNIDLPSSMVGQIVSSRLGSTVNHDGVTLRVGKDTFFESDSDLFVSGLGVEPSSTKSSSDSSSGQSKPKIFRRIERRPLGNVTVFEDENGNQVSESDYIAQQNEEETIKQNTLQKNTDKLTVLPLTSIDESTLDNFFREDELTSEDWFRERFAVYAFEDTDFLDTLKQDKMINKYNDSAKKEGLSTLIPIKYSFSIIGNSGIKRGDMFKITGIPKKYSERGIFQVTEISQTITTSGWQTEVVGQFRQFQ
jgi:hypothetical protein